MGHTADPFRNRQSAFRILEDDLLAALSAEEGVDAAAFLDGVPVDADPLDGALDAATDDPTAFAVLDGAEPDIALDTADVDEADESGEIAIAPPPNIPPPDAFGPARERFGLTATPALTLQPRSYQQAALDAWIAHGGRGMVVLPTGAGKTVLALMAVAHAGVRTLVVVPTIELLHQWREALVQKLGLPEALVGMIGGGVRQNRPVTVITYDSAAMPRRKLDSWGLLIFDEAHHLPANAYRRIAERAPAPLRLGLSATPDRSDGRHADLATLVGPEIYRQGPRALSRDRHIAAYRERRVFVSLSAEEQSRYDALTAEYRWYLATHRSDLGGSYGPGMFEALIRRSGFDPAARQALAAQRKARMLALNAESKIQAVEELLERHQADKVIVFSEYNLLVDQISKRLLLPAITYRTPAEERKATLAAFRSGAYTKLVTGRVLNEGVDVPDANVAIVVSGSSTPREYIQRLGRVLRPKPGEAVLYELVTRGTSEEHSARRRRPKEEPESPLPSAA
ncbi:MAG: DEAD/DEAH box helicase [Chloroflexota bacterium]|nr:DEAD/DEAH box helicase [Chloroflexota bacterium]